MTSSKSPDVEIIRLPNRLKAKVCGSEHAPAGVVAPELIQRAHAVVIELSHEYPPTAKREVNGLSAILAAIEAHPGDCAAEVEKLRGAAREIMGQAETFGFPLLSRFGRSLYDFCEGVGSASAQQLVVFRAHVDGMQVIIRNEIHGDGGEIGRALLSSLEVARRRYAVAS